jgi:hypothetical protein
MGFTSHIFIYDSTYHALDLGVPGRRTRVGLLHPTVMRITEPYGDTVAIECLPCVEIDVGQVPERISLDLRTTTGLS